MAMTFELRLNLLEKRIKAERDADRRCRTAVGNA